MKCAQQRIRILGEAGRADDASAQEKQKYCFQTGFFKRKERGKKEKYETSNLQTTTENYKNST